MEILKLTTIWDDFGCTRKTGLEGEGTYRQKRAISLSEQGWGHTERKRTGGGFETKKGAEEGGRII